MTVRRLLPLFALAFAACEPSVVDAVGEPVETPVLVPRVPLQTALIHRYSFEGTETSIFDSKGAAHGKAVGTTLPGDGALLLAGGESDQYVALPERLIRGLTDATFEAWVTSTVGTPWQRIFDFGDNNGTEPGQPGPNGKSYLFLTVNSGTDLVRMFAPGLRLSFSLEGDDKEDICQAPMRLPVGQSTHVAAVIDTATQSMKLYQNGAPLEAVEGTCFLDRPLSGINDVNNWLGRSNYAADDDFAGIFDEFRIYNDALTDDELADSYNAGPNAGL